MAAKTPSQATLKKYGLTETEWHDLLNSQDGTCGVCRKLPKSLRLCIDHEHINGWKKLPPSERKQYVRGLLCFFCNRYFLARGMHQTKARNIVTYLDKYDTRG